MKNRVVMERDVPCQSSCHTVMSKTARLLNHFSGATTGRGPQVMNPAHDLRTDSPRECTSHITRPPYQEL